MLQCSFLTCFRFLIGASGASSEHCGGIPQTVIMKTIGINVPTLSTLAELKANILHAFSCFFLSMHTSLCMHAGYVNGRTEHLVISYPVMLGLRGF